MLLLVSSKVFSQKVMLNDKGDTTICFTVGQSKYLLKEHYELKKCDTLKSICEQQKSLCDSVVADKNKIINAKNFMLDNQNTMLKLKQYEVDKLTGQLDIAKTEVKKQKTYKWIGIVSGIAVSLFSGYYILTH